MKKTGRVVFSLLLSLLTLTLLASCGTTDLQDTSTKSQIEIDDHAETGLPTESGYELVQLQYLSAAGLHTSAGSDLSILGEVGKLSIRQAKRNAWQTLTLENSYSDPIVVMNPLSFNGRGPATIRVRNITSNSFQFKIDEWLYQNGRHKKETVSYMVAEAGSHTLGNLQLEVGTMTTNHTFSQALYATAFQNTPVVFTQTQSYNGSHPIITRVKNVNELGFEARVQEEEAQGPHTEEVVGYLAFSQGSGTIQSDTPDTDLAVAAITDTPYEVVRTSEEVNRRWYTLDFQNSYNNPIFLASIQSYKGPNTANLRYRNLSNNQVSVKIQEERSLDNETYHVKESIGYVVLEAATLVNNTDIPSDTNSAPVAVNDSASFSADQAATIISVLENDSDADTEDTLSIDSITQPSKGVSSINAEGSLSFDPASAFDTLLIGETETVSFDYSISDGTETATATVTVTITGILVPNVAPVAVDDTATFTADQAATVIPVLDNDTDENTADVLSITNISTQPTKGQVSLNDSGQIVFDPAGAFDDLLVGQSEAVSFSYTMTDGTATDIATVAVTITGSKFSLTVEVEGLGLVAILPEGPDSPAMIDCGNQEATAAEIGFEVGLDCNELFNQTPTQTVTLTPFPGEQDFSGDGGINSNYTWTWQGCTEVLENNSCSVEMSESRTIQIIFTADDFGNL